MLRKRFAVIACTAFADAGDQHRGALELLADRVRRFQSILPPPLFRGAHLRLREIRMLES